MARFELKDLYLEHFGYTAPPYPVLVANNGIGLPIIDTFTGIKGVIGYRGVEIRLPVRINGKLLPNEPLVSLSRPKALVRTPITGGLGSVKEDMGLEDWEIVIRGIAIDEQNKDRYPEKSVKEIDELHRNLGSLPFECPMTDILNINLITIKRIDFSEISGSYQMQPYEISAFSDVDPEEQLKRLKNI